MHPLKGLRTSKYAIAAALCGLAVIQGSPSHAQLGPGSYVYTDKSALLLMPSTRVSDDTYSFIWSPDSARLLTFNIRHVNTDLNLNLDDHTPPESDMIIGRWNKTSRFADSVWTRRYTCEPFLSGQPAWIPHTPYVTQVVFWQEKEIVPDGNGGTRTDLTPNQEWLWINAARSTVHEIPMAVGDRLEISPSRSLAVIINQSGVYADRPSVLTPAHVDGSLGAPLSLPVHKAVVSTTWTQDGGKLALTLIGPGDSGKGSVTTYASYDPVSSEIKAISAPTQYQTGTPAALHQHEIVLKASTQHLQSTGVDVVTHPLWAQTAVKSEKSSMLICSDADLGAISPDGATIAYRAQRSSWVAAIKPVPLDEFKAMLAKALRTVAISNAKQLGLGIIMWATDHDDTFPQPGDINGQIMPYLNNSDALFDQFTYTYSGGPMSAIASPADTVIGTVGGPGGQAVIYSDGHVKWQNR